MRRVWTNHGLRLLVVSAVLAILALLALCLVLLIRTNQTQAFKEQASENCRQINVLKSALRGLLDDAEATTLERADPQQQAFIKEYYARQRARFAADDC